MRCPSEARTVAARNLSSDLSRIAAVVAQLYRLPLPLASPTDKKIVGDRLMSGAVNPTRLEGAKPLDDKRVNRQSRFHLKAAAFLAISDRFFAVMPAARALPPMRPSATAAAFLPSSVVMSSISPAAILAIMTALPEASAGRFSPFGPRGKLLGLLDFGAGNASLLQCSRQLPE